MWRGYGVLSIQPVFPTSPVFGMLMGLFRKTVFPVFPMENGIDVRKPRFDPRTRVEEGVWSSKVDPDKTEARIREKKGLLRGSRIRQQRNAMIH